MDKVLIFLIVLCVIFIIYSAKTTFEIYIMKYTIAKLSADRESLEKELQILKENKSIYIGLDRESIKYSKELLDYTTEVINNESVRQFEKFKEGKENVSLITRKQVEKLIEEISGIVYNGLKIESIDFDKLMFSREYYESIIIGHTIFIVSGLIEKI